MRRVHLTAQSNGVAERWVGTVRRELLDHVVVLNARHLQRLLSDFVDYYHADRSHPSLRKDTPSTRPVSPARSPSASLEALRRVGGPHLRYEWRDAA